MVGKGNNSQLIKDYFLGKDGYNLMSAKEQFSPHYFFKWVQSAGEIDFHSFKEGLQIVNHIPNISMVSAKLELLRTLREWEMEIVRRGRCPSLSVAEFTPKTFRLDLMSD